MENVITKVKFIVEGNISYVNCDNTHVIELTIDSATRDLWAEQIIVSAETIKKDGTKINNGMGVIRTKKNKLECKVFKK